MYVGFLLSLNIDNMHDEVDIDVDDPIILLLFFNMFLRDGSIILKWTLDVCVCVQHV